MTDNTSDELYYTVGNKHKIKIKKSQIKNVKVWSVKPTNGAVPSFAPKKGK
jgi:ribosomal protein L20A (L18A)